MDLKYIDPQARVLNYCSRNQSNNAGGEKQKAQTQTSSLNTDNLDAKKHERMQRNKQHAKKSRDNSKKHMLFLEQQVVVLSKQTHILHLRLEHVENKLVLERLL